MRSSVALPPSSSKRLVGVTWRGMDFMFNYLNRLHPSACRAGGVLGDCRMLDVTLLAVTAGALKYLLTKMFSKVKRSTGNK